MVRSWEERMKGATQLQTRPENVSAGPSEDELGDVVNYGLRLAIAAGDLSVAIAERATGRVQWRSEAWLDRFGDVDLLARHIPSSTELGELPLPPPGESWQRTRTMLLADGSEDLMDLVLLGSTTQTGVEFVTVMAKDRAGRGPSISDRVEIVNVINGALEEAVDGTVAVLYVDLDRFKVIYELIGSVNSVRVMEQVFRRLASTIRATDLLFRLPGDEFVVVASELGSAVAAHELAEKLRANVASMSEVAKDLALTASVGVAVADAEHTGESLLSGSETAVQLAKGRGRNRIAIHDDEIRSRNDRLQVVERQLRRAIERRDVRFAFQPVVALATGELVGAEALLRLGGDVGLTAMEVVAAAEKSGLMGALGALVLEGVDHQLGEWLRTTENPEACAMVNLAGSQLSDKGLIQVMQDIANSGYADRRLAIEVPEQIIRNHRGEFMDLVSAIKPRFKIGIDGFGHHAGALHEYEDLGIDYVKLHRAITAKIATDENEQARLHDILGDAAKYNVDVIALGVEDKDQAKALSDIGCRKAQGFLYAGALSSSELLDLADIGFAKRPV